jgi:hypothetical protein
MIAQAATLDVLSNGMGGTRNGAMQVVCFSCCINLFDFAILD